MRAGSASARLPTPRISRRALRALRPHPVESAREAGLRYVDTATPGIRRVRSGRGFRYADAAGQSVRDAATLARIRALAIPPAWTEVWICPLANGHVQATGRDARGRKQYRYHAAWGAIRNETKFGRMVEFARALPRIRARVEADLARPGLPREKVLAAVVRLLERSLIRVGCDEYARANDAYGLASMCDEHVRIAGAELRFRFRGKGGREHGIVVRDRRLAGIVRRCRDLPGQDLFQYVDDAGAPQCIGSGDVNAYLREVAGADFTAKDFRTWGATLLAAVELAREAPAASARARARAVGAMLRSVSERLGNTAAVCRKYYVNPCVVEAYEAGALHGRMDAEVAPGHASEALERAEQALVALLRRANGAQREAA
ncbi:MAG: DNA topoisomerase I [Proteobacteria bacterium]|nr:MAG: DNA topoisomerase I [Pseudomonadota bacterium]